MVRLSSSNQGSWVTEVKNDRKYLSYLLRLWRVEEDGEILWRASLEVTQSGERFGFASLENLLEFLKEQTQACSTSGTPGHESRNG
jgi:hypothetical protein